MHTYLIKRNANTLRIRYTHVFMNESLLQMRPQTNDICIVFIHTAFNCNQIHYTYFLFPIFHFEFAIFHS